MNHQKSDNRTTALEMALAAIFKKNVGWCQGGLKSHSNRPQAPL
jgi:hypothetical protein